MKITGISLGYTGIDVRYISLVDFGVQIWFGTYVNIPVSKFPKNLKILWKIAHYVRDVIQLVAMMEFSTRFDLKKCSFFRSNRGENSITTKSSVDRDLWIPMILTILESTG